MPEITYRVQQAQVHHRAAGYCSRDSAARIADQQPMARQPKRSHNPQDIGQEKTPLEVDHVCGKLIVVVPERDPEKHDRQRGYPLGPGNAADGYVHIDFLCLRFIQLVGRA
jgi:hypothetical protein